MLESLPLSQVVETRTGYQFRAGVQDEVDFGIPVGVVQVRDMENGMLRLDGLQEARIRKPEPYLIKSGDVLLLTRGHHFSAAGVNEDPQNVIASHFFVILKIKDKSTLLPEFLAWQLNHPRTQDMFKAKARQTHIPFVSRADVESFLLAIPSLEIQERIVQLDELVRREAQLSKQLIEARLRLADALTYDMATGQIPVPDHSSDALLAEAPIRKIRK